MPRVDAGNDDCRKRCQHHPSKPLLAEIELPPPNSSSMKWSRNNSSDEFKVTSLRKECVSHKSQDCHCVAKDQRDHEAATHRDHCGNMQVKQAAVLHFRSHGQSRQKGHGKSCDRPPMQQANGQAKPKDRFRIIMCRLGHISTLSVIHQTSRKRIIHAQHSRSSEVSLRRSEEHTSEL